MDDIAIIDHQSSPTGTSTADEYTASLLQQYNNLGSDVMELQRTKNEMWSWVTHR